MTTTVLKKPEHKHVHIHFSSPHLQDVSTPRGLHNQSPSLLDVDSIVCDQRIDKVCANHLEVLQRQVYKCTQSLSILQSPVFAVSVRPLLAKAWDCLTLTPQEFPQCETLVIRPHTPTEQSAGLERQCCIHGVSPIFCPAIKVHSDVRLTLELHLYLSLDAHEFSEQQSGAKRTEACRAT